MTPTSNTKSSMKGGLLLLVILALAMIVPPAVGHFFLKAQPALQQHADAAN